MDNAELAIGIDLGTTNSLIAVWKDGAAQLIPNKFGEYLTPSIISMDENNHILVGKPAVSRRTSHPDKTAALFKRAMGSNTNWRLGSDRTVLFGITLIKRRCRRISATSD